MVCECGKIISNVIPKELKKYYQGIVKFKDK